MLVLLIQFGLPARKDATGSLTWFSSSMANWLCFGVVFLVVGSIVLRKLQARAKARSIEAEIRAQGQEHLEALPPTGRSDMEELQQRFDEALESLRASKLGRGALYALPWYVIIGPPGSGKTTAITESGLNFPFLKGKSQGRGIRGLGGTRNCDWWFTDQSILLDTAGRYTTQSEDRDEWLSFLGMIKRSRQQKPINGVVVAIAITDLLGATPEAIEQHAVTIRERIDELVKELEVVFPVYLMFTKCDLLDGFVESFNTLSKEQRAQVWGATLAHEGHEERKTADQFREEFSLLCRRVDEERLRLLVPDQSSEKQRKVLSLSLQLRAAARPLGEFVGKLTEPNPYSEGSELRGFYFTSGTQEGAPIDFVMDKMSSALGLAPGAAASPMTDVEAKSYFLRDLFADVMYGDRELAHSSSGALRRQALVRGATIYGAAAVAAIGVAMCISGWLSTRAIYDEYEGASKELGINPAREAAPDPGDRDQFNEQRRALEKMLDAAGRWALFRPGV
ncbi:MAG: type VI secretion system membrane subunit TssM, partial [Planctomycetota bacterium]|nr:type VI secretion system membrane subunit TssM [Planctomycetota bacterium]